MYLVTSSASLLASVSCSWASAAFLLSAAICAGPGALLFAVSCEHIPVCSALPISRCLSKTALLGCQLRMQLVIVNGTQPIVQL